MKRQAKTVGALAREYGVPGWKVRRVADAQNVELTRVGLYRLITPELEALIRAELQRTGWLSECCEAERC